MDILSAAADIATGGVSSLIQGAIGDHFSAKALKRNVAASKDMAKFNNDMTLNNLSVVPGLTKAGLKAAGLSDAVFDGNFSTVTGTASSPSSSAATVDSPIAAAAGVASLRAQQSAIELTKSQKRKTDAEAKSVELANRQQAAVARAYEDAASHPQDSVVYGTGDAGTQATPSDVVVKPTSAPPPAFGSKEWYDIQRGLTESRSSRELSENAYFRQHSVLQSAVDHDQLNSPETIKALARLPVKDYERLEQSVAGLIKDNEGKQLANEITKATMSSEIDEKRANALLAKVNAKLASSQLNFNPYAILSKLFDNTSDFTAKDFMKAITAILMTFAKGK